MVAQGYHSMRSYSVVLKGKIPNTCADQELALKATNTTTSLVVTHGEQYPRKRLPVLAPQESWLALPCKSKQTVSTHASQGVLLWKTEESWKEVFPLWRPGCQQPAHPDTVMVQVSPTPTPHQMWTMSSMCHTALPATEALANQGL